MANKTTTKKPLFGNRRSHSLRATRHAQKPNLQKVTLEDGTKVKLSVRELRTLKKTNNKNVSEIVETSAE
jgi:large subunit ribosomal protein L28